MGALRAWWRVGPLLFVLHMALLSGCDCGLAGRSGTRLLATDADADTLFFQASATQVSKEVLLYNRGKTPLVLTDIKVVDDPQGVFSLANTPIMPLALAPGRLAGVTLTVIFSPKANQPLAEARLRLTSSDADNVNADGHFFLLLRERQVLADPVFECGALSFGAAPLGERLTKTCSVRNRGLVPWQVTSVSYKPERGGKAQDIRLSKPALPFTVASGASMTLTFTYMPSDTTPPEDIGAFLFHTNTDQQSQSTARLRVSGEAALGLIEILPLSSPCASDQACALIDSRFRCKEVDGMTERLCLDPSGGTPLLKFPYTTDGKETKRSFLVRNIGKAPLQLTQISLSPKVIFTFSEGAWAAPVALSPGEHRKVSVTYHPTTNGRRTGHIEIQSDATNRPRAKVLLEAASSGCDLDVLPRKLVFSSPESKKLTLVNRGNAPCQLKKASLQALLPGSFAMLPAQLTEQTLSPNASFSFLVSFSAPAGAFYKGSIAIESTDPDEPLIKVPLEGQLAGQRRCLLVASPGVVHFGMLPVGRVLEKFISIENKGYGNCSIRAVSILPQLPVKNTAFRLVRGPKVPLQLGPGGHFQLTLSYAPGKELSYQSQLEIQSDDEVRPSFLIRLSGTAKVYCLEVLPSFVDFGAVQVGCASPKRSVEVFSLASAKCKGDVLISKIQIGIGAPSFRINAAPHLPLALKPGQSVSVELAYKPTSLGQERGTLELQNDIPWQSPVVLPLVGEGVNADAQRDVFRQRANPLADILFIVDDSCSMEGEQLSLANNFQAFINWAIRLQFDFHIMVATTDVRGIHFPPGCARGNPTVITSKTASPVATFAQNAKVGAAAPSPESGLESAYKALTEPALSGCNKGFYRPDASLAMIFVSDAPDLSPHDIKFYINFFRALKGPKGSYKIRASAVIGPVPGGCAKGSNQAQPGTRYVDVVKALKGLNESICTPNWSTSLSNIGAISFGYQSSFLLSRQADISTLLVEVNGRVVQKGAQGWNYDAASNAIVFSKVAIPAPSSTIVASYRALCLP